MSPNVSKLGSSYFLSLRSYTRQSVWVSVCAFLSFSLALLLLIPPLINSPHRTAQQRWCPNLPTRLPNLESVSLSFFNSTITMNDSLFRCFNSSFPFLIHRNRCRNYVPEFHYAHLEFWIWSDNHKRASFKSSLFLFLPVIECYSTWVRE